MLEILKGYPDDVLAVSGKGEIMAEDYKSVLVPELNARVARHGAVRMLYMIGPEYKGFSAGAAWADMTLGISHWRDFGRIAVVSDVGWLRNATRMFAPFFHHAVRIFPNAELEDARAWISAKAEAEAK